jgi:hypothetical protein
MPDPYQIYVSPANINKNTRHGTNEPVVTIHRAGQFWHGMTAEAVGAWKLVWRPEAPMLSGARVWVETLSAVLYTTPDGAEHLLPACDG